MKTKYIVVAILVAILLAVLAVSIYFERTSDGEYFGLAMFFAVVAAGAYWGFAHRKAKPLDPVRSLVLAVLSGVVAVGLYFLTA